MENENTTDTTTARPFGYWLRAVDRLLAREFETAFEAEGITRRDWRLLTLLDGDVVAPEIAARLTGKKLRGLTERGWITESDGTWTLTDEGRAAKARLGDIVDGIRSRVSASVTGEEFATTMSTLEAVARELGWNPDERMPRGSRHGFGRRRHGFSGGHGFGRGHGHGFGRPGREGFDPRAHGFGRHEGFGPGEGADRHEGFGPGEGFGPSGSFGPGRHERPHGEYGHGGRHHGGHGGHGRRGHGGHGAQRAYERGFDAGFTRGAATREASVPAPERS